MPKPPQHRPPRLRRPSRLLITIFQQNSIDRIQSVRFGGFLPYMNKAIKLPDLLRNNRRGLPYLLLALDHTEPLELMILSGVRASAQDGGLEFKKIQRRKMAGHRKRRIDEKR